MTLSFRPIAAMLLGIVTMLSQETKSLSPEGTWNGYMDGNPAIALNVHREGDGFAGAVTFFVVTAGAEPAHRTEGMSQSRWPCAAERATHVVVNGHRMA